MVFLAFAEGTSVQLLPDFSMLFHMFIILLMIWILNRTFFRPVNRIIEARVKNKGGRYTEAERILQEVEQKQTQYNAALLEARNQGYEFIEKQKMAAVEQRETALAEVREEVTTKVSTEKREIEEQTAQARAEIAREAEVLADRISQNILKTA